MFQYAVSNANHIQINNKQQQQQRNTFKHYWHWILLQYRRKYWSQWMLNRATSIILLSRFVVNFLVFDLILIVLAWRDAPARVDGRADQLIIFTVCSQYDRLRLVISWLLFRMTVNTDIRWIIISRVNALYKDEIGNNSSDN